MLLEDCMPLKATFCLAKSGDGVWQSIGRAWEGNLGVRMVKPIEPDNIACIMCIAYMLYKLVIDDSLMERSVFRLRLIVATVYG